MKRFMICCSHIKVILLAVIACIVHTPAFGKDEPCIINTDNSVTITFVAPDAQEVKVRGNFIYRFSLLPMLSKDGSAKMTPIGNGVWTYTSAPLASELYWYNFEVDDSVKYDTRNKNTVRDINTINNYFIVTGGIADDYVDRHDKKGTFKYEWYPSSLNGKDKRRMAIYLPYGYTKNTSYKYPVLYLLHGSGGDEKAWLECGRLAQIMDNLIASGRCKSMIVVMPNGNVELAAAPGDDPKEPNITPSGNNISSMFGKFESSFMTDIVSYIDANYRTIPNKRNRAIAGLSLGGLHTLYIALNNPDEFDYVGLFSAQTTNALNDSHISDARRIGEGWNQLKQSLPFLNGTGIDRKITSVVGDNVDSNLSIYENLDYKLKKYFEKSPNLFYIAVGTDDFTKKLNDDLRKKLNNKHYPYTYNETDGGHTWTNWRKYLVDFLPRLFN